MKKVFFSLFISWCFNFSFAQTTVYHPFPDSDAVWNIHSYEWCGLGFDRWEHFYSYEITGDTSIGNFTYHKLSIPIEVIVASGQCTTSGTWTVPGSYRGAIRQDTSVRKVFIVPPTDSVEQLLYDFEMQVGDTVRGYTQPSAPYADIVQSVDSILVGNAYRKRWYINPCYYIYFIEGIGSTYGLLEFSQGCVTDGNDYSITCFSQGGQTLYPDTTSTCEIINAVKNSGTALLKSPVSISPNPFHKTATIEIRNSKFENGLLRIYNSIGLLQRSQTINNKSVVVNRDGLTEGLYYYELRTKNYDLFGSGKFIVN